MADYKTSSYKISDIYQGGYSSMKSPAADGFGDNNYIRAGSLSMTTYPRTANVLKEVSSKLSSGLKNIEVTAVSPEIFDSIPKEQLKEIHRLSKLTGIDVSMHGIIIEPSGVGQQGFNESERELAERKITETLKRSRELNPTGNIPVTFHSSAGIPASQLLPPSEQKSPEEGGKYRRLIVANRDTGKMIPLEPDVRYYPGKDLEKGEQKVPEQRINEVNATEWDNQLDQVFFNQERTQEILGKNQVQIQHLFENLEHMKKEGYSQEDIKNTLSPQQKQALSNYYAAENYLKDINQQTNALFSKAYEFGDEEQKQLLKKFSDNFIQQTKESGGDPFAYAEATRELTNNLRNVIPKMYVPVEDFAIEKSSKTFGNAAFNTYKEFKGNNVPIMVIENPPAGTGLSTGDDIRRIVEESRKQFVEVAKSEGMDEFKAVKEAEKLIGATWDVGHINMLRGHGYSEEDIIKETEKVAEVVKHVHLSDNFGMEHTELPMGMGNVPLKEMMERLGEKGFEAKKVIEASSWWQHWQTSPFKETLEGVGSPIYGMKMAPYWEQSTGLYQGYMSGLEGAWLPQVNYETFGGGFSRLPSELGGQSPGAAGSRMSGRGME